MDVNPELENHGLCELSCNFLTKVSETNQAIRKECLTDRIDENKNLQSYFCLTSQSHTSSKTQPQVLIDKNYQKTTLTASDIVNLSDRVLTKDEENLLKKGLKFCPTNNNKDIAPII